MNTERHRTSRKADSYWLPSNGYTLEQGVLVEITKRLLAGAFNTLPDNIEIEVFAP